jgi:ubiquinone/menaquinone biosynthesis C-methylase UbiE
MSWFTRRYNLLNQSHQIANDQNDFDRFGDKYREIHNKNIKISGADSEYFSEYKVKTVCDLELKNHNDEIRILDLGCGDGNSIKYFRSYFPNSKIYGADVSSKSIEVAKSKNISDVQLNLFDGKNIPYQANFFDIIFLAGVLHHVPENQRTPLLTEVYRTLGDGGRLYVFEHNPNNPLTRKIVKDCIFDENAILLSSKNLNGILSSIGFKSRFTRFTIFFPRHRWFKPLWDLERYIQWVPIGGQFFTLSGK